MNTKKDGNNKEKCDYQITLRLPRTMYDQIQKSSTLSNTKAVDWIRGACQERLDREKYKADTPIAKMTVEQLKDFVQKVMLETDIEAHTMSPSDVARYDQVLLNQARPFDLLDEFSALEKEEDRERWAAKNLYELRIEIEPEDMPEGIKIYGVLQGRIVWTDKDGGVGLSRFEEIFPDYVEAKEEVTEEPAKEEKEEKEEKK